MKTDEIYEGQSKSKGKMHLAALIEVTGVQSLSGETGGKETTGET